MYSEYKIYIADDNQVLVCNKNMYTSQRTLFHSWIIIMVCITIYLTSVFIKMESLHFLIMMMIIITHHVPVKYSLSTFIPGLHEITKNAGLYRASYCWSLVLVQSSPMQTYTSDNSSFHVNGVVVSVSICEIAYAISQQTIHGFQQIGC